MFRITELKTLKDFENCLSIEKDELCSIVNGMALKQEAIKYIKAEETNEGFGVTPDVKAWIKHFFNIEDAEFRIKRARDDYDAYVKIVQILQRLDISKKN